MLKRQKLGRKIEEISVGEKLALTEKIEDKSILIYLGLTDDANPLYIQHDYASVTPYKRPIVPTIMLTGIVTAAVSKVFPGPGSHIVKQTLSFPKPVFHYSSIDYQFQVVDVNEELHQIEVEVKGTDESNELVITGTLVVTPPYKPDSFTGEALENF